MINANHEVNPQNSNDSNSMVQQVPDMENNSSILKSIQNYSFCESKLAEHDMD
jgi:hypothetical protein